MFTPARAVQKTNPGHRTTMFLTPRLLQAGDAPVQQDPNKAGTVAKSWHSLFENCGQAA